MQSHVHRVSHCSLRITFPVPTCSDLAWITINPLFHDASQMERSALKVHKKSETEKVTKDEETGKLTLHTKDGEAHSGYDVILMAIGAFLPSRHQCTIVQVPWCIALVTFSFVDKRVCDDTIPTNKFRTSSKRTLLRSRESVVAWTRVARCAVISRLRLRPAALDRSPWDAVFIHPFAPLRK